MSEPDAVAERLIASGAISRQTLERAQRAAEESGSRVDQALNGLGLVSDDLIVQTWSSLTGIPAITATDLPSAPPCADTLLPAFLRHARCAPLCKSDPGGRAAQIRGDVAAIDVMPPVDLNFSSGFGSTGGFAFGGGVFGGFGGIGFGGGFGGGLFGGGGFGGGNGPGRYGQSTQVAFVPALAIPAVLSALDFAVGAGVAATLGYKAGTIVNDVLENRSSSGNQGGQGKGERGETRNPDKPGKHTRPDPNKPGHVIVKRPGSKPFSRRAREGEPGYVDTSAPPVPTDQRGKRKNDE